HATPAQNRPHRLSVGGANDSSPGLVDNHGPHRLEVGGGRDASRNACSAESPLHRLKAGGGVSCHKTYSAPSIFLSPSFCLNYSITGPIRKSQNQTLVLLFCRPRKPLRSRSLSSGNFSSVASTTGTPLCTMR